MADMTDEELSPVRSAATILFNLEQSGVSIGEHQRHSLRNVRLQLDALLKRLTTPSSPAAPDAGEDVEVAEIEARFLEACFDKDFERGAFCKLCNGDADGSDRSVDIIHAKDCVVRAHKPTTLPLLADAKPCIQQLSTAVSYFASKLHGAPAWNAAADGIFEQAKTSLDILHKLRTSAPTPARPLMRPLTQDEIDAINMFEPDEAPTPAEVGTHQAIAMWFSDYNKSTSSPLVAADKLLSAFPLLGVPALVDRMAVGAALYALEPIAEEEAGTPYTLAELEYEMPTVFAAYMRQADAIMALLSNPPVQ